VHKSFNNFKTSVAVWTLIITLLSSFLVMSAPGEVQAAAQGSLNLEVSSAVLMDATSGRILYEKNPDEALPPASMTKMMTAYLVLEAIKEGRLSWEDPVRASEYAHFLGGMTGGSVVFLAQGAEYTVREMFEAMEINSANDATVALAEKVGTTEQMFVEMMNEKAKELGMKDTLFVNSTGLSTKDLGQFGENAKGEENLLSARDLAVLARALVMDYPEILGFSSVPKKMFPNGVLMRNYNEMVPGRNSKHTYEGLDGLKTGHTQAAQYCFTGTAQRGELRLISVVMGAETNNARFSETRKLLDYGFNNFEYATVLKGKDVVPGAETSPVQKGVELTVPVVAEKSIGLAIPKGEAQQFTFKAEWDEKALVAPITAGQVVGKATLHYKDQPLNLSVPLIAQEDVEEASWIRLLFRAIGDWFGSIFNGIKGIF
jgi:D-alanyl-D-alanine carboxypeptidase (penicillin-binding protein 5/6)